jgi:serine/threonine protein kinase/tetratricopeptide (TPR) repeat protein
VQIGTSVGPYRILSHLGSGGMGEVWLAEDTRLQRRVALKMVRPASLENRASRERLMREARAAAALNHPHIATVHDVLEEQGEVVIVFEYVEGETLHARIARERIPVDQAVDIASQIAKALVAAHAHGIVHRDLKPANVIIGADRHVKVLDFGIARILALGSTETTGNAPPETVSGLGFIGTASYAAPEQMVSSAVDERADLYALGVVLFEMISGRRPFQGNDRVQLASIKLSTDAPPLSSTGQVVPASLEHLIASLLERDRDRRPASAHDVLSELRTISGSTATGSLPIRSSRRSWTAAATAALIVALVGFGMWGMGYFTAAPSGNASAPPVVAVLPLENISGDPSRDFVAAGIAESLISSLAAVPSVTVLSRASVAEARSRIKDSGALTKDLGATFLVDGSVQESGGTLRVSLSLIRQDRSVAWADTIEGTFERIFDLQSRLASALSSALVVRVSASEQARMNDQATSDPQALAAYWRGQTLLERRDIKGNLDASIAAFSDAVARDNNFALAHAALGAAYWAKYLETSVADWTQKAVDEGTTALRLDPGRPEVRYTLAVTLSGRGRNDEAMEELNRALAIRPNYDDARRQLGLVLGRLGRIDEAVAEYRKALALRPNAASTYSSMGLMLYSAARYDEAIDAFRKATELQPDNFMGFQRLGTAYHAAGKVDLALENYRRATEIRPSAEALSNIGTLHYGRGDFRKAVEAYRQAIELRPNSATTQRNLGDSLSRLNRKAEAQAAYRKAVELSEADLKVNPSNPRLATTLAVHLRKAGELHLAETRIQDALAKAPKDIEVLYGAAVIRALNGQTAEAMALLERAVAGGFSRSRVNEQDDFASLRKLAAFKKLVTSETP